MASAHPNYRLSPTPVICCDCGEAAERNSNRQLRCSPCRRAHHAKKERARRQREPEKIAEANRSYRAANRARLIAADRDRYISNRQNTLDRAREKWAQEGGRISAKRRERYWRGRTRPVPLTPEQRVERLRARARARYHSDRLRWRMAAAVKRVLKGHKERRSWVELVGYSADELRRHIERQFLPGMSWANMGEWHVDHIIPLACFRYGTPDDPDFRAAWALTNLRPLWAPDNQKKGHKRVLLI
jgi:hypothetical protein